MKPELHMPSLTRQATQALIPLSKRPQKQFEAVFSVLFNERLDFLERLISNFLLHVPSGALIINASAEIVDAFVDQHADLVSEPKRVFLFKADRARSHWGATLMLAHLASFNAARQSLRFDYFSTLASNSLFTHPLNISACIESLERAPSQNMTGFNYPGPERPDQRAMFPPFYNLLRPHVDKLFPNEIEGFFTHADNWDIMQSYQDKLVELQSQYELVEASTRLAVEEFFPAQVVCGLGDKRFINIHTRWFDANSYTPHIKQQVSFNKLLEKGTQYGYCGAKWFTRHGHNPLTLAMCDPEHTQLVHMLYSLAERPEPEQQIALYALALGLTATMQKRLQAPGRSYNVIDALDLPLDWTFHTIEAVNRQWHELALGATTSYLFHEKLPATSIHLKFSRTEHCQQTAMQVSAQVNPPQAKPQPQPLLLSFWYVPLQLPAPMDSLSFCLQIHDCNTTEAERDQIFKYCALLHERAFRLVQASAYANGRYVFTIHPESSNASAFDNQLRIGIALHANVEFTFSIEVYKP